MEQHIIMLCSLDTKGHEAKYLKDRIEERDAKTILLDIGYGGPAKIEADFDAAELANAAGSNIDTIRAMRDTGAASKLMMQGAIVLVHKLINKRRCDGIIAFGGASSTTLATGVMKAVPVGIPKLMISSAAAMPAYAAKYFGSKDITMMHCVVDISGLNDLTRRFLDQGAGGICGMASCSKDSVDQVQQNKLVAVTSFRFAEVCCQSVMRELERRGYTPIPFHAQGVGEDAMEDLIAQGVFLGVADVVPAGLSEQMLGGNRAARPDRLEAAARAGVPQVIATSGFDMISCGPISRRNDNDPLWIERGLEKRQYSVPDRYRVEARTTANEVEEIAKAVAVKLNCATAPACVMIPLLGWSSLSVQGAELYDPDADAAFASTLREHLTNDVPVIDVRAELNSEEFANAMVENLHSMIESRRSAETESNMRL